MELMEFTPDYAKQFGYEENEEGVLVGGLTPGGKAESADVKRGDLIKEVNHQKVGSIKEFTREIKKVDKGETISLLIRRPRVGFVVISIER